jgi:hypothetical protein
MWFTAANHALCNNRECGANLDGLRGRYGPLRVIVSSPEAAARLSIDVALVAAGWVLQDVSSINLYAGRGIAVREFPLKSGYGFADYLLFVDGEAVGAVEAKKEGETLTGVEVQTAKYADGLRDNMNAPTRPLPFLYESTGIETQFTNLLDPHPVTSGIPVPPAGVSRCRSRGRGTIVRSSAYPSATRGRYWSASATWAVAICSSAARSAMVRASFSTRW